MAAASVGLGRKSAEALAGLLDGGPSTAAAIVVGLRGTVDACPAPILRALSGWLVAVLGPGDPAVAFVWRMAWFREGAVGDRSAGDGSGVGCDSLTWAGFGGSGGGALRLRFSTDDIAWFANAWGTTTLRTRAGLLAGGPKDLASSRMGSLKRSTT